MTDEKRKTLQQAGALSLELEGSIINVTGAALVITNGHRGLHPTFSTEEDRTAAVILTSRGTELLKEYAAESETAEMATGQNPATAFAEILQSPLIGLDGEMEDVGTINHVFRLVKPKVPCMGLRRARLSERIETLLQETSLVKLPLTETDPRKLREYYVLTPGAACVGMMKYAACGIDLDHWLVPVLPTRDETGKVIGYGAFAPAKYLIDWQE